MTLLRMYADCLRRAFQATRKNAWTLALPMVYLAATLLAGILLSPLGMIGGILAGILQVLCLSSFLYFVAQAVLASRARPSELSRSFVGYFWPIMSYFFVIWIASRLVYYALAANERRDVILLGLNGIVLVLANAVPEVIYQKGDSSGLSILTESVRFIQRYWIEWFLANVVAAAVLAGVVIGLLQLPFGMYLIPPVVGALLYVVAVFRGNLFHVLDTTSAHQRRLRYRDAARHKV